MKPNDKELEMAIVAAERMRESGADEHHVAKTLLYLYQRLDKVEKVLLAAENYLHSGQDEPRHAELILAIETAKTTEDREAGAETEVPG